MLQRSAIGQTVVNGYPVNITQYSNQLSFINPAATVHNAEFEVAVTTRKYLGFLRNNQTYLAEGAFRIAKNKKTGFHGLGCQAYYDKEGAYLKRYRGYLLYSYHLNLSENYRLAGGISLGVMTYQVGNEDYYGGTANGLDGSMGFIFSGKKSVIAFSVSQLPQTKIQPITEITELTRFYQLLLAKEFRLSDDISLPANLNAAYYSTQNPEIYIQTGLVYKKAVSIHALYRFKKQVSLMVGLENLKIDAARLGLFFSYDIPIEINPRFQAFEISVRFYKPEKRK